MFGGAQIYNNNMTPPRLYCPPPLPATTRLTLPAGPAHHAVRVLRLRVGDAVVLFDGHGGEVPAQLVTITRDQVEVDTGERVPIERESPLALTLVQALPTGDKMDLVIQKAVELGVSRIVPVQTRRCVMRLDGARAEKRVRHWQDVAVSACEQCGRNRIPRVDAIAPLDRVLATPSNAELRLLLSPADGQALPDFAPAAAVTLLVGPEGGLAADEAALARTAGYRALRLGPRVLRTETAGLAVLAAINACWGDWR